MGRIKTKQIKRITHVLIELHGDRFTTVFDDNKKIVEEFVDLQSKKLRNSVAGYATRLKRRSPETV